MILNREKLAAVLFIHVIDVDRCLHTSRKIEAPCCRDCDCYNEALEAADDVIAAERKAND